jgi:hypothetical protein
MWFLVAIVHAVKPFLQAKLLSDKEEILASKEIVPNVHALLKA